MYDPDEGAELLQRLEALLPKAASPEVRARMIADGLDPDALIKRVVAARDQFIAADQAAEKAVELRLQAEADVADAAYQLFKDLGRALQEYKRTNPLDPRLEEWEAFWEAWAEQMPKAPEE